MLFKCVKKYVSFVSYAGLIGVIVLCFAGVPVSAASHPHGLGAKIDPSRADKPRSINPGALPKSVSLKKFAPTPGDQGQVGSCVAWATGYTLMGWYAKESGIKGAPFAPMYVYSQINGGVDGGALPSKAYKVLSGQGIASQLVYAQGNYDWATLPTAAEKKNAALHKSATVEWITGSKFGGGESVKLAFEQAIASGHPATLSMEVFEPFFDLDTKHSVLKLADVQGTADEGGHEITAVGYNATGLVIENSWGASWGAKGFATLGWDFVERYVADGAVISGFAQ